VITERDTRVGGISFGWAEAGEGDPPFVLIHGMGWSSGQWYEAMTHLGAERRAIAVDLPGFGRCDPVQRACTPGWLAGGVRAFLDAIGVERAILVGNSLGGLVASWFAAAWPERTAGLVLAAPALPSVGPSASRRTALAYAASMVPGVGLLMSRRFWDRDPSIVVAERLRNNFVDPGRATAEAIARYEADAAFRARSIPHLRAALSAQRRLVWAVSAGRERTWRVVRSIRVPTMVLWGAQDRILSPAIAERTAAEIAGAHLVMLDDVGHNPQAEKPEEFARAVLAFTRSLEMRVA